MPTRAYARSSPPLTVTLTVGSGRGAGPACTLPSSIENLLPWQVQLIVPSLTEVTGHPWCVQIEENPRKSPFVGWVTTTWASGKISPPPTGTPEAGPSTLSAPAPDLPPAPGAVVPPLPEPPEPPEPPHAASSGSARPRPAAPVRARRRVIPSAPRPLPVRRLAHHFSPLATRRRAALFLTGRSGSGAFFGATGRPGCLASLPSSSGARNCPV